MNEPPPNSVESSLPAIANDLFCQRCGYNLRGLTGNHCPECGGSLDGVRSPVPRIPWMYRKELGWWRAYWRTIRFVMFRQAQFCDEMARPVSFGDSQLFRWITVLLVATPSVLLLLTTYWTWKPQSFSNKLVSASSAAIGAGWPLVIFYLCWLLFLAAATGVPSYFFHLRDISIEQQNRAIALSYYACGPLVFLGIPILTCAAGVLAGNVTNEPLSMALGVLTFTLPIAAIAAWWLDLMHLARRLFPARPRRAVGVGIAVPVLWTLLVVLLLLILPVIIGYVVVIIAGLR